MDIELTKGNGTSFKLSDYGIVVKDFIVESMEIDDQYQDKENMHGRILLGSNYRKRKIVVPINFRVNKLSDIARVRDLLYGLVVDTEPFYIREMRKKERASYRFIEPIESDYQEVTANGNPVQEQSIHDKDVFVDGKRYQVKLVGTLNPQQNDDSVNLEIEFETAEIPFGESLGTSLELERNEKKSLWSIGNEIPWDKLDRTRKYTFENTAGNYIYYHGTANNDQFNLYQKVTIVIGEETKSFAWNLSYSELMTIKDVTLHPGDLIVYDGIRVFRNGVDISDKTNIANPKFRFGYNNFEINQIVRKIQFDMKFYYK